MSKHWGVDVRINGKTVLTIESNCVSGRQLSFDDEETIRNCAEHLLAFVGPRKDVRNDHYPTTT